MAVQHKKSYIFGLIASRIIWKKKWLNPSRAVFQMGILRDVVCFLLKIYKKIAPKVRFGEISVNF